MKFLNLNAIQTYLTGINYALIALLTQFGCLTDTATGKVTCTAASFSPEILFYVATVVNVVKLVFIPAVQPGGWFRNMFETKVPVSTSGATGTVKLM